MKSKNDSYSFYRGNQCLLINGLISLYKMSNSALPHQRSTEGPKQAKLDWRRVGRTGQQNNNSQYNKSENQNLRIQPSLQKTS